MLKLVEVANYLTKEFNTIGALHDPTYTFNIQAEVGANKNAADVQGIVKTAKTKIAPVLNARNVTYNLLVELSIVAPTTNFNLKNIEEIVNSFATSVNGQEVVFESGKGLVTMTLGQAGTFKQESGQGNIVPLSFDLQIVYTEGVATSRSKHWLLDDEEIPYLTESVIIQKEGRTNKINSKKYSETFMLGQQKRYRFTFLYDENSTLCQNLQKDILDGDANKQYTLKYYDGITYTAEEPYSTTVSLFETGDTKSQKPDVAQFDITFADADKGQGLIRYYMALVDNPFDEATENTKCFEDTYNNYGEITNTALENQRTYYQGLINTNKNDLMQGGADWCEILAPNISALYLTNQIYRNTKGYNLFKLLNKNYAIIKMEKYIVTTNQQGVTSQSLQEQRWMYYWIKNPQVQMNGQVSFDLRMDSLQTYLFDANIKFEGNMIEKASLNRWVDNGDGTVSFDGTPTSKLFEREELKQVAKRLVSRAPFGYDNVSNDFTTFLTMNVVAWVYVNLKRTGSGSGGSVDPDPNKDLYPLYDGVASSYVYKAMPYPNAIQLDDKTKIPYNAHCCLVFPILKDGSSIQDVNQLNPLKIASSLDWLNKKFGGSEASASPYIQNVKLSFKPPFNFAKIPVATYNETFTTMTLRAGTQDADKIIEYKDADNNVVFRVWELGEGNTIDKRVGYIILDEDYMSGIDISINSPYNVQFAKSYIVGTANNRHLKDTALNPKLLNSDYRTLSINMYGSNYEFDIQKMNTDTFKFSYREAMTMDVSKFKIVPAVAGVYSTDSNNVGEYEGSYNGLVGTNDTSIELSTDQYDIYLANNKNAYLSFQNQQNRQWVSASIGLAGNIIGGVADAAISGTKGISAIASEASKSTGGVSGIVGGLTNFTKTMVDQMYQRRQFNLTLNDMRSAPDIVSNANGNAIFNGTSGKIAPYCEIYEALPHELHMANDDMFMNGYTYNIDDDIFPYINKRSKHIRANFNYVQAIIGNISNISMCSEARDDLRQRLANGVRFWHTNSIDYDHENYEKWLEYTIVSGYDTFTTTSDYVGYYVFDGDIYTRVTNDNKNKLGIHAGTTIAYSNVL